MPRFYFNTDDGVRAFRDEDGVDLPSVADVPREAVGLLRDLVDIDTPLQPRTIVATVCDATGAAVLRTTMSVTSEQYLAEVCGSPG